MSNKKKIKKINKLQLGLKELGESEMPQSKHVEILQPNLQNKVKRVAEEIVTSEASSNSPKLINNPEDTQEEEDSDNDKPSTSKVIGHRRSSLFIYCQN